MVSSLDKIAKKLEFTFVYASGSFIDKDRFYCLEGFHAIRYGLSLLDIDFVDSNQQFG